MPVRFIAAFSLVTLLSAITFAAASVVERTGMWSGKIKDETLRKLAPQSGFVADAETWKKLWTAWRPKDELPKVDFAKELILVGPVPGPNHVVMQPTIEESRNVKFTVFGTEIAGPGFGYKLIKMVRDGVKTVNGKPIEAKGGQGVLVIPKTVGSFKGHTLAINEYFQIQPNKWGAECRIYFDATPQQCDALEKAGFHVEARTTGYRSDYAFRINSHQLFWELVNNGYVLGPN